MELTRLAVSKSRTSAHNSSRRIKNMNMLEYSTDIDSLNKWSIPHVSPKEVYSVGTFTLMSQMAIKTMERTTIIGHDDEVFELLDEKDLEPYMDKYKYVHIGLIQMAFKPLTLPGLNASILACLRDARCMDWTQSLMETMQTSLCHGPVYFNVHPNLCLSFTDKNLFKAITLNTKTYGYNFLPGSETITVIYRIYFRALNTLAPKAKHVLQPGETIMIETNLLSSQISVKTPIKWNDIQFPEKWVLPQVIPPLPVTEQEIDQIIQTSDGDIEVSFF